MAKKLPNPENVQELAHRAPCVLPGADEEDPLLVQGTVEEINDIYRKGGLETARRIGKLVVDRFFGGDLANAHSRKREHKSYQAVVNSPGLMMAASNLWYCVATYEQYGQLPVEVRERLAEGHYRQLAHVKDEALRIELATKVVDEDLTVNELKAAIAATKVRAPDGKRRGRPALAPLVKELNRAQKVIAGLPKWDVTTLAGLCEEDRETSLAQARALGTAIAEWLAAVEASAGEVVEG